VIWGVDCCLLWIGMLLRWPMRMTKAREKGESGRKVMGCE
jgi:hypothetical protein